MLTPIDIGFIRGKSSTFMQQKIVMGLALIHLDLTASLSRVMLMTNGSLQKVMDPLIVTEMMQELMRSGMAGDNEILC